MERWTFLGSSPSIFSYCNLDLSPPRPASLHNEAKISSWRRDPPYNTVYAQWQRSSQCSYKERIASSVYSVSDLPNYLMIPYSLQYLCLLSFLFFAHLQWICHCLLIEDCAIWRYRAILKEAHCSFYSPCNVTSASHKFFIHAQQWLCMIARSEILKVDIGIFCTVYDFHKF